MALDAVLVWPPRFADVGDFIIPLVIFAIWIIIMVSSIAQAVKKRVMTASADADAAKARFARALADEATARRSITSALAQAVQTASATEALAQVQAPMQRQAASAPVAPRRRSDQPQPQTHAAREDVAAALWRAAPQNLPLVQSVDELQRRRKRRAEHLLRAFESGRDPSAMVVAAAIFGPCAAARGAGHQPGDWW